MTEYLPTEKGVPIRMPSTANLMLDSADRNSTTFSSCWDFQINRPNSIMNGFFTRIGTTEVVLEWCEENVSTKLKNDKITFDISGIGANTYSGSHTITLVDGFYTAADAYNSVVSALNDLSGTTGAFFVIDQVASGLYALTCDDAYYEVGLEKLAEQLDIVGAESVLIGGTSTSLTLNCPDLRPYRYIDIVSPTLTYNQDLKDNTTAPTARDVLCRWYFSEDQLPALDAYGFPVLMGYSRFCFRRIFNPPKQVKWNANQPIGYLSFQAYDDQGLLLPASEAKTQWLMTLQLSEV